MAEKNLLRLQSVSRDSICVVANLKNTRFMVVINEKCCISDLMKEIEVTFAKLSSIKVSVKTLKNSANAVLPEWYLVTHLLKNHDEVYAFIDDRAELSSVDVTKCGHCCTNTMKNVLSSSGMSVLPDSGCTSLQTSREGDGPEEHIGMNEDKVQDMVNRGDGNLSHDGGNEVLSEIFSIKDHNGNVSKARPDNQMLRNGNAVVDHALEGKVDESQNRKEISKDESGSESVDESTSLSHESDDKKAENTEKTAQQNKAPQQTMLPESSQTHVKTKNAFKALQENCVPGAAVHDSDTDEESTDSETIDPGDRHKNKNKKLEFPVKKQAEVLGKQMEPLSGKNMEVTAARNGSRGPVAKVGNIESESSDSSSESEVMEVDNVGNNENNIIVVTSGSTAESKEREKNGFVNSPNIADRNKDTGKKTKDSTTNKTVKDTVKNRSEDKTNKLGVKSKSGRTGNESVDDEDNNSSSSSSDSDDGKKMIPKNNTKKSDISKNGIKIVDARMTKETESIKETIGDKGAGKNVVKAEPDSESDSESSWSSDEDDVKNVKTVKNKSTNKSETKVTEGKSSQKEKQTKLSAKNSSEGRVEDKSSDKDKQTGLDRPVKGAGEDKRKNQPSPARSIARSVAKSVARSKKSVSSSKLKEGLKKVEKAKGKRTDGENKSDDDSSVSTLKPPLTQSKVKGKSDAGQSESGESHSDDEDAVEKDGGIAKDGKRKGKGNSGDAAGHGATTPEPKEPSASRKSAVMLSANKVATWLLSNPVTENAPNKEQINGTESPLKTKTLPKTKAKGDTINVKAATDTKSPLNRKAASDKQTLETTKPQKRKLDEDSEHESTKSKKNKRKKPARIKSEKQLNEEKGDEQAKPAFKSPALRKKGKNTPLTLPKKSRGLEALIEDESDYTTVSAKISKKQKVASSIFNQRVKPTGFGSQSNINNRKAPGSKKPKTSQGKKASASQPREFLEPNSDDYEYVKNVDGDLSIILNDKSVKWYSST